MKMRYLDKIYFITSRVLLTTKNGEQEEDIPKIHISQKIPSPFTDSPKMEIKSALLSEPC